MGRGVVVGLGCAILLSITATGAGGAQLLSDEELEAEMGRNRAIAAYVRRNGPPDAAESRFLADRPPWDDREIALYYLDRRLEIVFARAYILGRPEIEIVRAERPLSDAQVAALAGQARVAPGASGSGPAERAEAAADRAEDAAARVEAAVGPVERAAERAEAVAMKMADTLQGTLRK